MASVKDSDGKVRIFDNEDSEVFNVTDDGLLALASAALGGDITFGDGNDILVGGTTGTKIGQASTKKLGFYGVTPAARPAALVQTYSTAASTNPAMTATAVATTAASTAAAAAGYATKTLANAIVTAVNALKNDVIAHKKFVNKVVDQLQSIGLLQ